MSGWATYNPATGATEALLAGGQISALEDLELQRLLAGWTGSLADLAESESRARLMHDEVLSFLTLDSPMLFELKRLDRSLVDTTVARDPRLRGLLLRYWLEEGQALQDTERVVAELDAILARLAALRGR